MSDPTPRDTRLFDAGATWATEPSDQRGYGDALRDAADRAGAGDAEVRRVLADRGYRGDDEPVAVLLARTPDGLGARSTDPYGTGDGSYPTLAGGSS